MMKVQINEKMLTADKPKQGKDSVGKNIGREESVKNITAD